MIDLVDEDDIVILYSTAASTLDVGDQVVIEGEYMELTMVDDDRADIDEVFVKGYSHNSGDVVSFSLYADDEYDVWSV